MNANNITKSEAVWGFATLCACHVDYHQVYLQGDFTVNLEVLHDLTVLFNRHFNDQGLNFVLWDAKSWLVQFNHEPQVITKDYREMIGKSILGELATGKDKKQWYQWFTESQLILNRYFTEKNIHQLSQNSYTLWFWGIGDFTKQGTRLSWWRKIMNKYLHKKKNNDGNFTQT